MFGPRTVDKVVAALAAAVESLERIAVEQSALAMADQEQIDRLSEQRLQRVNERDRALRVRDRLAALVE